MILGYTDDSIMLGQYKLNNELEYIGKVALGITKENWYLIKNIKKIDSRNDEIWIEPVLVCTVKYMKNSKGLRQAVFKGLRQDKEAIECKQLL